MQQVMNVAAVGIALGTFMFTWAGIYLERDWFLMMGLVACILGNLAFMAYLVDQGVPGERNDSTIALFACFTVAAFYGVYAQCCEWYEEGYVEEEGEAESESEGNGEGVLAREEAPHED